MRQREREFLCVWGGGGGGGINSVCCCSGVCTRVRTACGFMTAVSTRQHGREAED